MTRTHVMPGQGVGEKPAREEPVTHSPAPPRRRLTFGSGRSAVAQFALSGLAIVVLLGLAGVELLRHAGSTEALRDAKNTTRIAAVGVAQPNLTPGVLRGDPRALARFDRIMRASVVKPPVV